MIYKIISISLVLSLALVLGCNKDTVPCTTCPTSSGADCEDIQNVKHFFYFKVGSWWVYEEENSGARDSVYVTSALENPSNYDFDVEVYSTYQDYYYRFWPVYNLVSSECPAQGVICKQCLNINRSKYKPGDFVAETNCFFFTPELGAFEYEPHSQAPMNRVILDSIMTEYSLSNVIYERTIRIHEENTFMEGKQATNHYFSENVGLVKKELLDSNQVWNLVDYHIEL